MPSWPNENRFENYDYVSFNGSMDIENSEEIQTYDPAETVYQEYTNETTTRQTPEATCQISSNTRQTSGIARQISSNTRQTPGIARQISSNTRQISDTDFNWKEHRPSFLLSLIRCTWLSIQLTVLSGVTLGIVTTTMWWLDLNLAQFCYSYTNRWYQMPVKYQKIRLTAEVVQGFILEFWPLSLIIPAFKWSLLKKLQLPYISIIAAFTDACYRLFLQVYGKYKAKGANYFCNFIFLVGTLCCFSRVSKFVSGTTNNQTKTILLTFKLSLQILLGVAVAAVFDNLLVEIMVDRSDLSKAIIASSLPVIFFFPKLFLTRVIARFRGAFSPGRAVVFTLGYQVGTTMVCRLAQAKSEELALFIAIGVVHGVLNVADKLTLPLREKFLRFVCGVCRGNGGEKFRSPRMARLIADQVIVHYITETTALFTSSAAVQILSYYFSLKKTGQRHNGYTLFQNFLIRGLPTFDYISRGK